MPICPCGRNCLYVICGYCSAKEKRKVNLCKMCSVVPLRGKNKESGICFYCSHPYAPREACSCGKLSKVTGKCKWCS